MMDLVSFAADRLIEADAAARHVRNSGRKVAVVIEIEDLLEVFPKIMAKMGYEDAHSAEKRIRRMIATCDPDIETTLALSDARPSSWAEERRLPCGLRLYLS